MNRTVKKIKHGADHDNSIKDQYKMFKYYKEGMFVEVDSEESSRYRQMCLNNLKESQFRLKRVKLVNYKGFNELSINLDNDVILIAANNGYGKTGILEAIYLSLSWFYRLVYGSNQGWRFGDKYINRRVSNAGMLVNLEVSVGNDKKSSDYQIDIARSLGAFSVKSDYADFKDLAEMYIEFQNSGIVAPMFAYYSVERGKNYPDGGFTSMMTTSLGMGASNIQRWLQGSLAAVKWSDVSIILIYSIIGVVIALLLSRNCNILMLGNKNAKSLGINGDVQMIIITGVAVFLSSISTSIGGVISFVGLVVPHICRMIIGSDHKYLIPFSGLVGANLLLLADTLGRVIMKPYEVPVGIIMAIIGAPFFLYILRRSDIK